MSGGPPQFLRTRWGSAGAVAVGLALVAGIFAHLGPARVVAAVERSASVFPLCVALEGGMLACTVLGLRTLYGPDRGRLPAGSLVYAGLVGYVTMLLMPAGRAFAEVARAAILARRSSTARAAHAAYQMQAACLLGNAAISIAAFAAALRLVGSRATSWVIGGNVVLTAAMGAGMLVAGRRGGLGGLLGRLLPRIQEFGASFDELAREGMAFPWAATLWECCGRGLQTLEFALLVSAVGGPLSPLSGLLAEGTHLVGAAIGDLIPAQLGAAEANFALYARALSVEQAGAVAIALLAHLAQLCWVLVGLAVVLVTRPSAAGGRKTPIWPPLTAPGAPAADRVDGATSPALEVPR